ncbi:MAG TPA: hypothetical protein VKA08_01455 [Balneolales bacterium]|nr:hypothetical protein [Balneolales bacterium]
MGFLYLILSVLCSLVIVHLLKVVKYRQARMLPVLTVNYFVATLVASISSLGSVTSPVLPLWLILLMGIAGALFILNFAIYGSSVNRNGVGVSVTAMRLSLVIPVLVSIIGYREQINFLITAGLIGVFIALSLLSRVHHHKKEADWKPVLLILLFLGTGFSDAALKIFRENGAGFINQDLFMAGVFGTAFLIGIAGIIWQRQYQIRLNEIGLGVMVGIPNLYSSIFMIMTLKYIGGAVAFSIVNILIVAGGTILGYVYWKDNITKRQFWGITVGMVSIVLMIIGR